jgi:hypothetical protein
MFGPFAPNQDQQSSGGGFVRRALALSVVAVLTLSAAAAVWAQGVSTSQIAGVVRDSSGGVMPGVEVTVVKTDTGLTRTVFTNQDGAYTIPNLPVGPYKLTAVLQGFNTYSREGIVLQVQSNPTIDITLTVGGVQEAISVVANAEMVETKTTAVGQVIDNARVIEMPLNGRVATELIFLAGLATSAPAQDLNTNKNYPTVTISVAGGQANGMTYIMDGGTFNDPFNNLNLPTPNPDALQEFKVETSALPARYGHHAASAVNVVTKSGTNALHGNGFWFMRDYHLNANNAFATTNDGLKRNQIGGTLGGPLKRDKLFFFGSYQGTVVKQRPPDTFVYAPTAAMRAGDFTKIASADCQSTGAKVLKAPFVNNKVDPSQFSPAALNILKYVPVPTDGCGKTTLAVKDDNNDNQILGKIDYTINNGQTLTGRYFYARYSNPVEYDGKNVLMIQKTGRQNEVHGAVVGHNWILNPSMVNAFHFTYNKTVNDRPLPDFFAPKDVGIAVDNDSSVVDFMGLAISSGFNLATGGNNPGYFNSVSWQIADDFDWIKGRHQLSAGFSLISTKIETQNNRPTNGQFSFNGSVIGIGLADFMLGKQNSYMQGNKVVDYDSHFYSGVYVQDSWKPRANLTLNYGVRWEPFIPIQNDMGYSNNFSVDRFNAGIKSTVYSAAPAGLLFPGDSGYVSGNGTYGARYNQWAPRVGVIWSPLKDNSMSVRAAWGLFYDTPHLFFNTRFANNPPWGAQIQLGATSLDNPWTVYPGGNPFPAIRTNWQSTFPDYGVYVTTPMDLHNTRLQQWNVSVQKGFGDLLFSASYLGNRGKYVWRATELNPGVYMTGASTTNLNQRRKLYLANQPQGKYYSTIGMTDDSGHSVYDGLLLSAQKRMSKGWSVLTNYTLSKCMTDPATTEITGPTIMNPDNPGLDYSYCSSDRRHVWNLSVVWRAPNFGKSFLGYLASDWQVAPIVRVQSGNRTSVTTGADNAQSGMGGQRAVLVAGQNMYLDNPAYTNPQTFVPYLNPAAFAAPAAGTYSTEKPFMIVNPGSLQNDMVISRTFGLGAARGLQFRWEIFNIVNHVNLNAPSAALNSSTFGKISSAGDPRIMQLALKFTF